MKKLVWSLLILALPIVALADYKGTVRSIESTAKIVTVVLNVDSKPVTLTTKSIVIEEALVSAYITGATVTVETEPPPSMAIKRVQAFGQGKPPMPPPAPGDYKVNRLATQRQNATDRLEVFLLKQNVETRVNVFDRLLDPIFLAAFDVPPSPASEVLVDVDYDGNKAVTRVRIGLR